LIEISILDEVFNEPVYYGGAVSLFMMGGRR